MVFGYYKTRHDQLQISLRTQDFQTPRISLVPFEQPLIKSLWNAEVQSNTLKPCPLGQHAAFTAWRLTIQVAIALAEVWRRGKTAGNRYINYWNRGL